MAQLTPLFIVASPKPRVGKTLLARLLIEFFGASQRPVVGYDINPQEPTLTSHFPRLVFTADIADTRGQMALFDQLIAEKSGAVVIDLGYAPFEQFFAVMGEIGFVAEAQRRSIEPIVLFVADRTPATVRAYAGLRDRLPSTTFVPVHNEAVSVTFEQADYPPSRAECRLIRLTRLSPIVRGVVDRPNFSFGAYLGDRASGPTEIHSWVSAVFTEFRDLELRLMMGRLTSGLGGGVPEQTPASRRTPRA
jgi:hypothetical protein